MTAHQKDEINNWVDRAYKLAAPAALALMAWMTANLATKDDLGSIDMRLDEIEKSIIILTASQNQYEDEFETIDDLERRVRELEKLYHVRKKL